MSIIFILAFILFITSLIVLRWTVRNMLLILLCASTFIIATELSYNQTKTINTNIITYNSNKKYPFETTNLLDGDKIQVTTIKYKHLWLFPSETKSYTRVE